MAGKKTDKAAEAARAARRAYKREWAKANPEKIRGYQLKYWEKRAAQQAATPAE